MGRASYNRPSPQFGTLNKSKPKQSRPLPAATQSEQDMVREAIRNLNLASSEWHDAKFEEQVSTAFRITRDIMRARRNLD